MLTLTLKYEGRSELIQIGLFIYLLKMIATNENSIHLQ